MNNEKINFERDNFVIVRNFYDRDKINFLYTYTQIQYLRVKAFRDANYTYDERTEGKFSDDVTPYCYCRYSDPLTETMLVESLPNIENYVGKNIVPTYSYWRMYENGADLKRHKDRHGCEISVTICVGFDLSNLDKPDEHLWPLWIDKTGEVGNEGSPIFLSPGDIIIYKGCKLEHWREPFIGNTWAQIFLHFDDKDNPHHKLNEYDGRGQLGLPGLVRIF